MTLFSKASREARRSARISLTAIRADPRSSCARRAATSVRSAAVRCGARARCRRWQARGANPRSAPRTRRPARPPDASRTRSRCGVPAPRRRRCAPRASPRCRGRRRRLSAAPVRDRFAGPELEAVVRLPAAFDGTGRLEGRGDRFRTEYAEAVHPRETPVRWPHLDVKNVYPVGEVVDCRVPWISAGNLQRRNVRPEYGGFIRKVEAGTCTPSGAPRYPTGCSTRLRAAPAAPRSERLFGAIGPGFRGFGGAGCRGRTGTPR